MAKAGDCPLRCVPLRAAGLPYSRIITVQCMLCLFVVDYTRCSSSTGREGCRGADRRERSSSAIRRRLGVLTDAALAAQSGRSAASADAGWAHGGASLPADLPDSPATELLQAVMPLASVAAAQQVRLLVWKPL